MIPLPEMLTDHSEVFPIDIYAKPKDSDYQWSRIKSIDYLSVSSDDVEYVKCSELEELIITLKQRETEIKNSNLIISNSGLKTFLIKMSTKSSTQMKLFEVTKYRRKLVVERLIVEVFKLSAQCIQWTLDQKKGDKPLLQWLVEDRKLYSLFPHYQAMLSGFRVCYQSALLNRLWLKFERCTKMDEMFHLDSANDSVFPGTEYKLNEMVCPPGSTPVFAETPQQTMRNKKLFGHDKDIAITVASDQYAIIAPISSLMDGTSDFDAVPWFDSVTENRREQPIELQVVSHRGHWSDREPQYLLEKGTKRNYQSTKDKGAASEDWLIFKIKEEQRVVPTKVVLRNWQGTQSENEGAIKTISISGSTDNNFFEKWCKIENIENEDDKLQIFIVDPVSAHVAHMKRFRYYRVNILENYGDKDYNAFYEFAISGVYMNELVMDLVDNMNIDQNGVISLSVDVGSTVFVHRDPEIIRGSVHQKTTDQFCIELHRNNNNVEHEWFDREKLYIEGEQQLSDHLFAAKAGTKDDGSNTMNLTQFTFESSDKFQIPSELLVATSNTADAVHLYAKPKGKEVNYQHIKTVRHQFDRFFFSRYCLHQKDPFRVTAVVKVQPYSESSTYGGQFEVKTSSDIIISPSGSVDVSKCGLRKDSKHKSKTHIVKFGRFIKDSSHGRNSSNDLEGGGAGGGIICMFACGNVTNEGELLAKASEIGKFSGGSVYTHTDGVFKNSGRIDCGKDGTAQIECVRFVNNGEIIPAPLVVMQTADSSYLSFRKAFADGKPQLIKLKVVNYRGHYGHCNIENVLEEGTANGGYWSKEQGDPDKDWFTFRLQSKRRFIPKSIVIRNYNNDRALKKLTIAASAGECNGDFVEWIQLCDIRKRDSDNPLQTLDVDQISSYFAWARGFYVFRIKVRSNHGGDSNGFHEFRIYGIYSK